MNPFLWLWAFAGLAYFSYHDLKHDMNIPAIHIFEWSIIALFAGGIVAGSSIQIISIATCIIFIGFYIMYRFGYCGEADVFLAAGLVMLLFIFGLYVIIGGALLGLIGLGIGWNKEKKRIPFIPALLLSLILVYLAVGRLA